MSLATVLDKTVARLTNGQQTAVDDLPRIRTELREWIDQVQPRMSAIHGWLADCTDAIREKGLVCSLSTSMDRLPGAPQLCILSIELSDLHMPPNTPSTLLQHNPLLRSAKLACRLTPLTDSVQMAVQVPGEPETANIHPLADMDQRFVELSVSSFLERALLAG